ncbi:MAG: hypothetical protein D3908_07985, partial [Candidatus Electrothrix sp. AUS4]|nr:hypothetical protein [Candidatus Electrothrix sp. AUS4]
IGTGVATIPAEVQRVFDVNDDQTSINMQWYQNKFVGRHWLLGDFTVDLAEDMQSTGSIKIIGESAFGLNIVNTNEFYFDFKFKRFPALNMRNTTPIRNSGIISAIPPVGSVFKLDQVEKNIFEFKTGANRIVKKEQAPIRTVKFNQCDVVVFPERNVALKLIRSERIDNNSYSVTVEIKNITDVKATFAYFSIIHYAGIHIENDYGFVLLNPNQSYQITYKITSTIPNRTVDLPFFAALYKPESLNGSNSLNLDFEF